MTNARFDRHLTATATATDTDNVTALVEGLLVIRPAMFWTRPGGSLAISQAAVLLRTAQRLNPTDHDSVITEIERHAKAWRQEPIGELLAYWAMIAEELWTGITAPAPLIDELLEQYEADDDMRDLHPDDIEDRRQAGMVERMKEASQC